MNFSDTIQHWLQGQINAAVAGHSSRIAYLEDCNSALLRRLEKLEAGSPDFPGLSSHVEHMSEHVSTISQRLLKLEKAYPDMATTKDLLKDTDPSVLTDKMHEYIEQVVDGKLDGYAKRCDLEDDVKAILDDLELSIKLRV